MSAGRLVGRALFVLVGVALGAAVTEASLHLLPGLVPLTIRVTLADKEFRTTRPHGRFDFVFRPDLDTLYTPTAEMSYRLKTIRAPDPTIGLRDDGWSGAPWAVALGDSFTSGMGVELEQTWPERLETSLGRDVVNLGVDGYTSPQETALLLGVGLPLAPKVALYLVNFNDAGESVKYLDASKQRARDFSALAEGIAEAPHARPLAAASDAATTICGWVAPLKPRPQPRVVTTFDAPTELSVGEGRGFTLVARFVAPAGVAKSKRPRRMLRVAGPERGVELMLLQDGRVRVDLGGDPQQLLTSHVLENRAPNAVHAVAVEVAPDGAVTIAVDDQTARRVLYPRREPFGGALTLSASDPQAGGASEARALREVRWYDEALAPLDALRDDATAADGGPRGPWINDAGKGAGLRSFLDGEGRLHVAALGRATALEAVATRPLARDRPTHLACVASATGLELFVDGTPAGSASGQVALPCLHDLLLGRDGDGRAFVGALGTTGVFARKLDAAELARLATRAADGSAPLPEGAVAAAATALWRFRSSDVHVFDDGSGSGHPALARGEFSLDEEGFVRLAGRGGVEVRARPELEGVAVDSGHSEAGRSPIFLLELLHLFRRDGLYALSAAETSDWLPFRSGPIDQVFRKSAVEGRLFRPDRNALEFCEGVGNVLESLDEARRACERAGVKLVAITSASKEAVYFPQAKAELGDAIVNSARPDWVQRSVEQWCTENGVACISLLAPLRAAAEKGENLYFRIDAHWNANGHRVAAAAIEAGLRELGVLR